MSIDARYHAGIRKLDVNEHKVSCDYTPWRKRFQNDPNALGMLNAIEKSLSGKFGRSELVEFYKSNATIETKFLSAMIWGFEAPEGSRRDNRGPAIVEKMLRSKDLSGALRGVTLIWLTYVKRASVFCLTKVSGDGSRAR